MDDIFCPMCGGNLEYWKEYLVTKTQVISKNGKLGKMKKTPLDPQDDMQGFECKNCRWIFNVAQDVEKIEEHKHLMDWLDSHEDELKV